MAESKNGSGRLVSWMLAALLMLAGYEAEQLDVVKKDVERVESRQVMILEEFRTAQTDLKTLQADVTRLKAQAGERQMGD